MNVARRSHILRKRLERKYMQKMLRRQQDKYEHLNSIGVSKDDLKYSRAAHLRLT